jgi:hypothetical protein
MDINDSYLAFIFDEACEYILSMRTKKEIKRDGKVYLEDKWIKEPEWIDSELKYKAKTNNNELINEMKKNLKNFK